MANFTLTGSPADSLIGGDAQVDVFFVAANGRLVGTDTVEGGSGAQVDILRITGGVTLAAAAFANTRGLERLQILTANPVSVTLDDAMVASTHASEFTILAGAGAETILGGAVLGTTLFFNDPGGDDLFEGGGTADTIQAGTGADTLYGSGGDDVVQVLFGEFTAADRFEGGAGHDTLALTDGAGSLSAAQFAALAGFERITMDPFAIAAALVNIPVTYAADGRLEFVAAQGNDTLRGSEASLALLLDGFAGHDRLTGGAVADTLLGGTGNDTLIGEAGNDVLDAGDGSDRLSGMGGNDSLAGGPGNDTISGGAGNDTINPGAGTDRMDGGAGNDLYLFDALTFDNADLIADESGNLDILEFLGASPITFASTASGRVSGIERILLGGGNDVFSPTSALTDGVALGAMTVDGGAGNDRLSVSGTGWLLAPNRFHLAGGEGADTLIGDDGADTLDGGPGAGWIQGGLGNDLVLVAPDDLASAPTIEGGDGFEDVLRITAEGVVGAAETANMSGIEVVEFGAAVSLAVPASLVAAMSSISLDFAVRGSAGDDTVSGSGLLPGTDLAVTLGGGDDLFVGGPGDETVTAGTGMDSIALGVGSDRVVFGASELSAADVVGADTLPGDTMLVTLAPNRVLGANAFAGVTGMDSFLLDTAGGPAGVRLPGTLLTQSGQTTVLADVIADDAVVVDGRAVAGGITYSGGNGNDVLLAGSGADTMSGSTGEDTLAGGDGGDLISLGSGGTDRDLALILGQFDGSSDINTSASVATADQVTGLAFEGNFIAVDWQRLGLPNSTTLVISAGQDVELGWGAVRFGATETIANNAFGSLTAVRNTVGARITNGQADVDERLILVIGGAGTPGIPDDQDERFAVYLFEDRDDNATVDSADGLYLLAIGDTTVPIGLGPGRGFTMTTLDIG